jgi:hypothetical protein
MPNDQAQETDKLRYKQTDRIEAGVTCQPSQARAGGQLEIYARRDNRCTGQEPLDEHGPGAWIDITDSVREAEDGRVLARVGNIQNSSAQWSATLHLRATSGDESNAGTAWETRTGSGLIEPRVKFERVP